MTRHFYVYEHWRPDIDVCFYVGKGHGVRSSDMRRSRNRHHIGIQKKLSALGMCVEIRMVADDLSEDEALKIECERIAFWVNAGIKLANQTAGGDGLRNPSFETRKLIAEAASRTHTGRVHSEQEKANRRAAVIAALADPKVRARKSAVGKAMWRNPEIRDRIVAGQRYASNCPERAEIRSKSQLGNKKGLGKIRSQESIAKGIATFKASRLINPNSDQVRSNMSAGQKRRFARERDERKVDV